MGVRVSISGLLPASVLGYSYSSSSSMTQSNRHQCVFGSSLDTVLRYKSAAETNAALCLLLSRSQV
jgi:hypothetical protein